MGGEPIQQTINLVQETNWLAVVSTIIVSLGALTGIVISILRFFKKDK